MLRESCAGLSVSESFWGIQDAFIGQMIDVVINMMKPAYPELVDKQAFIKKWPA